MTDRKRSLTLAETKSQLDKISSTFCGAKWTQVLFQLHLGRLHNCCLTPAISIDKEHLFDSAHLIEERKQMLAGEKIPNCEVCWKTEEKGHPSDRQYKSSGPWSQQLYQLKELPPVTGVVPTYIEVSLSNRCQLRCAYCSPENSSALYREAVEYGPYYLTKDFNEHWYLKDSEHFFLETDENPYVDAFLNWYPKIVGQVQVLRFTGGEPLLSSKLHEMLDLLTKYPSPDLELIFNSNFSVPLKVTENFIEKLKSIPDSCYGKISFVTSIDGWGEGAKMARWGLELELFEKNLNLIRSAFPDADIRFTATLNIMAFSEMKALLEKILEWKKTQKHSDQIILTTYPLHYPTFLSLGWCVAHFKEEILEIKNFVDAHYVEYEERVGFKKVERDMLFKAMDHSFPANTYNRSAIDFSFFMFQHSRRKGWKMADLPEKLQKLIQMGLKLFKIEFMTGNIDPVLSLKAIPWVDLPAPALQEKLKLGITLGLINQWAILENLLDYAQFLNSSWVAWLYEAGIASGGNKLMDREKFALDDKLASIILNASEKKSDFCWETLATERIITKVLGKDSLKKLKDLGPSPWEGHQLAFWNKVFLIYPELAN